MWKFITWLLGFGYLSPQGIRYYAYGRWYRILPNIGPKKYFSVYHHGKNVTSELEEVAGPKRDFHGINVTPQVLGYDKLTFHTKFGEKTFEEKQRIVF